jgi:hypothetical protein
MLQDIRIADISFLYEHVFFLELILSLQLTDKPRYHGIDLATHLHNIQAD